MTIRPSVSLLIGSILGGIGLGLLINHLLGGSLVFIYLFVGAGLFLLLSEFSIHFSSEKVQTGITRAVSTIWYNPLVPNSIFYSRPTQLQVLSIGFVHALPRKLEVMTWFTWLNEFNVLEEHSESGMYLIVYYILNLDQSFETLPVKQQIYFQNQIHHYFDHSWSALQRVFPGISLRLLEPQEILNRMSTKKLMLNYPVLSHHESSNLPRVPEINGYDTNSEEFHLEANFLP